MTTPNKLTLALREALEEYHGTGNGRRLLIQLHTRLLIVFEDLVTSIPATRPELENDDYDRGRQDFKDDLLSLLHEARKEVK